MFRAETIPVSPSQSRPDADPKPGKIDLKEFEGAEYEEEKKKNDPLQILLNKLPRKKKRSSAMPPENGEADGTRIFSLDYHSAKGLDPDGQPIIARHSNYHDFRQFRSGLEPDKKSQFDGIFSPKILLPKNVHEAMQKQHGSVYFKNKDKIERLRESMLSGEAEDLFEKAVRNGEILPREKSKLETLADLGYWTNEKKGQIFKTFYGTIAKAFDKKSVFNNFFTNYSDIYDKTAREARRQIDRKDKSASTKLSGIGQGAGNALKYGRVAFDAINQYTLNGLNPFRHWTAGLMFAGRTMEAAKETRFDTEKVSAGTRIKDEDQAYLEAMKLYEKATDEAGKKDISAQDLEKTYRRGIPADLQQRLQNAEFLGTGFISKLNQRFIKYDLKGFSGKLEKKLEAIENSAISPEAKKRKTDELLARYAKKMNDFDRMVSREGAVDSLAFWLRKSEKTAKGASTLLMLDTISLGRLARIIKEHTTILDCFSDEEGTGKKIVGKMPSKESSPGSEAEAITKQTEPAPASDASQVVLARNDSAVLDENLVKKAMVRKGEGIEHGFIRQLRSDPEKYGYQGDFNDREGIARWSGREAHLAAIRLGYVDPESGAEVRVAKPDASAYLLEKNKEGGIASREYQIDAEGNMLETEEHAFDQKTENGIKFEGDAKNDYEYISSPQKSPEAPEEISASKEKNEINSLENIEKKEKEFETGEKISLPAQQPVKDHPLDIPKIETVEPAANTDQSFERVENRSYSENILKLSDQNSWTPGELKTAFAKIDVSGEKNGDDILKFFINNNIKDPRDVFFISDIAQEAKLSLDDTFKYYPSVKDMRSTDESRAIITLFNRPNDQKALSALFGEDFQNLKGQTNVFKDGNGNMVITNKAGITSRESMINITADGKISAHKKGLIYGYMTFLENAPLTIDKLKIAIKYMTEVK
jgi:hypothetical protein